MCGSSDFDVEIVMMSGKWSRLFNYSNKKFHSVSCKGCGHTLLFKEEAENSILEVLNPKVEEPIEEEND